MVLCGSATKEQWAKSKQFCRKINKLLFWKSVDLSGQHAIVQRHTDGVQDGKGHKMGPLRSPFGYLTACNKRTASLLTPSIPKTLLLINTSDQHSHNQSTDQNSRHSLQPQPPHALCGEPITCIDHQRWCDPQLIRCYLPWTGDQCLINEKKNTRLSPSRWTDIIFLPISILLTVRWLWGTTNQSQVRTVVEGEDKSWVENKGWSAHWQHIKMDRQDKLRSHFSFTSMEENK